MTTAEVTFDIGPIDAATGALNWVAEAARSSGTTLGTATATEWRGSASKWKPDLPGEGHRRDR